MPILLFKKPYKAAILAGRKTATLRRWQSCKLKAGDQIYSPGVGYLVLDAVDQIAWKALTEADAKADGFADLAELDYAVRKIYPNIDDDGKSWFRLKFHLNCAGDMHRLASAIRAELDKAVRQSGL